MDDPNRPKARFLRDRVLSGPGTVDASQRAAAAANAGLSGPMAAYAAKVHQQATLVTDEDVDGLKASGLSEDQIFEVTVAAATGAGFRRLDHVLSLLEET